MRNRSVILFLLIFFVGSFLRFYQLGSVPDSLNWDEVSYGYNAYSLLEIGKDEYGVSYPSLFRAFGEYKQPVYMYLDVVSVAAFGLNPFAVRFPSAFFGSLSIIFVYLLVYELFKKQKFAKNLALLSMWLFAISPWSIQFSRAAFEANVALLFVITGTYLFIKGIHEKRKLLLFPAVAVLSLSLYTYLSAKVFAPLFFLGLLVYGYKYFKEKKIRLVMILLFFAICNIFWLVDKNTTLRGTGVIFTAQRSEILKDSIGKLEYDRKQQDRLGEIVHNRRVVYAQTFIANYLSHFDPEFLFIKGDGISRHHPPGMGQLYLVSLPFIILGIFFLFTLKDIAGTRLLALWFLLAPIASSLTFEAPHALRSLIFLPTWHVFEAAGMIYVFTILKKRKIQKLAATAIAILYLINSFYFMHQYFVHTNTDFQKDWQFGYKESAEYIDRYRNTDKRIVFGKEFEQPYIFYLFYSRYNSARYIATGGSWRIADRCYTIDNVYFGECVDKLRSGDIYVTLSDESVSNAVKLEQINYTENAPASTIYQYK